jgi:hypothetical protein
MKSKCTGKNIINQPRLYGGEEESIYNIDGNARRKETTGKTEM